MPSLNPIIQSADWREGTQSSLNISVPTVVWNRGGVVGKVNITTAGTAAGGVYDANATTGNTPANLIAVLPNTVGQVNLKFPVKNGLLIVPGTGQTVSVSFSSIGT